MQIVSVKNPHSGMIVRPDPATGQIVYHYKGQTRAITGNSPQEQAALDMLAQVTLAKDWTLHTPLA
jgi:hypothetical protein